MTEKEAREALTEAMRDALIDYADSGEHVAPEMFSDGPEIGAAIDALLAARTEAIVEYVRKYASNCGKWPSDMRAIQGIADRVELYFVPPSVASGTLTVPDEIDVDGVEDTNGMSYIGKATRQPDGTYKCLANVHGALALVSVRITIAAVASE